MTQPKPYNNLKRALKGTLFGYMDPYPKTLRTHILRLLGLKTILLYRAFGPF